MQTDPINLRHDPMVVAWIEDYESQRIKGPGYKPHADCRYCGWPHSEHSLCGLGATFGRVRLGSDWTYIDRSNVEYMVNFVKNLGPGFHWKNQVYFDVEDGTVLVRRIEYFNGHPHERVWSIPLNEWKSIVDHVARNAAVTA